MARQKRCEGITSKGKRCKALVRNGKLCAQHRSTNEPRPPSLLDRTERAALLLTIGDTIVNLAEKAVEHAPELFEILVRLDGKREPTVPTLRRALENEEFGVFDMVLQHFLGQLHKHAPVPQLPDELALQIVEACGRYTYHLAVVENTSSTNGL